MKWKPRSIDWIRPEMPTSIKRGLAALVLVSALPFVVLAAFLLAWGAQAQRETLMARGEQSVRTILNSLDQDIARANSFLKGISIARTLQQGDWPTFFDQTGGRLPIEGSAVLVYDVKTSTFISKDGSQPNPAAQHSMRHSAISGEMGLSDLFQDARLGRYASLVTEPLTVDGDIRYVLGLVIPADHTSRMLKSQALPANWITAIFDARGVTVARTHGGPQVIGEPGRQELIDKIQQSGWGRVENVTREGVRVENNFGTAATGWSIATGIPQDEFNQPIRNSLYITSAIGLLLGTLALILAFIVGNHLAKPVAALAEAARDLGRGDRPRPIPPAIFELSVVQGALQEAYSDLRRQGEERTKAEREVRDSEERLRLAMEAGGLGAWEYDPLGKVFRASARCQTIMGISGPARAYDELVAAIHQDDRELQRKAVSDAIAGNANFSVECRFMQPDGSVRWVRMSGKVVGDGRERVKLAGVAQDITRDKTAAQLQSLLLDELNHRVKNSLAQIIAIAHFTRRSQGNTAVAWDALESRIHAMAKTHDLLTANSWRGGLLREVLLNELAAYQDVDGSRLTLAGDPVLLSPKAMQALSLAVHELATNAAKYGALSRPEGRVALSWSIEGNGGRQHVVLKWVESGGPPVTQGNPAGFGSRLIEQVFTRELRGRVRLQFLPDGVRCEASFPLDEVDATRQTSPAAMLAASM
jgi:PAS domain S-box-containing protein